MTKIMECALNMENKLVLFVPYFRAPTGERQEELDCCLFKNVECSAIDRIILVVDDGHRPPFMHNHLHIIDVESRLTYRMWAELSEIYAKNSTTVLANSDIYFDDSVRKLQKTLSAVPNRFVTLSRLEKIEDQFISHPNPKWSQDAWAYSVTSPLPTSLLSALDIPLGVPRCDNKVAYVFAIHGWEVCNPCHFIRSVHVHETNQRAYCKKTDQTVLGGVAYVHPSAALTAPSKIDIDIWARGTDAIQSVKINRSLDLWIKEHLALSSDQPHASQQALVDTRGKDLSGLQSVKDAKMGAYTQENHSSKPMGVPDAKQVLSDGRIVWTDSLRRFKILDHQGQYYAHDTLQPSRICPLTNLPLEASDAVFAEFVIAAFVPAVLDTAPIIVRDRPISKSDCHFWQYPAATERQAWQNHAGIKSGENIDAAMRTVHTYLGLPWATYIDKKYLPEEVTRLFVPRLLGLRRLVQYFGWTLRVHTVCQQIYWRRLIETFQQVGVTDLHLSHATTDVDPLREGWKLRIHSWPLFAPNIEVPERRMGLTIGKPIKEKRYLASFIGAHMPHYRSDVRIRLFEAAKASGRDDILIDLGSEWHFNDIVYKEQVQHKPLAEDEIARILSATQRYNEVLSDSVFSFCPEGAGPNTLRLWESLAVGAIPVVMASDWQTPKLGSEIMRGDLQDCIITVSMIDLPGIFDLLPEVSLAERKRMQSAGILLYGSIRERTCFGRNSYS